MYNIVLQGITQYKCSLHYAQWISSGEYQDYTVLHAMPLYNQRRKKVNVVHAARVDILSWIEDIFAWKSRTFVSIFCMW